MEESGIDPSPSIHTCVVKNPPLYTPTIFPIPLMSDILENNVSW